MSDRRVGYRFHPTDEEIIGYFLKRKMDGSDSSVDDDIPEIDLCKFEPWDLPKYAAMEEQSNDQVWYFFCPRDSKYPNSPRVNRTTKAGYWKSTGRDRKIKARRTKKEIGTKKTLVFHKGRVPDGIKTNWIIHEYRSKTILPHQRAFTVCKMKEKEDGNADIQACDEGEAGNKRPTNLDNPVESPIQQVDQERQVESIVTGNGLVFRYPPAMQQQVHKEQGLAFENTLFTNGTGYEYNEFDTDEQEVDPTKFADSLLGELPDDSFGNTFSIFQPESNYEETPNTLLYNSNPPVITGYHQSGTTAQCSMETSNPCVGYAGSEQSWQMHAIQETVTLQQSFTRYSFEKEDIGSQSGDVILNGGTSQCGPCPMNYEETILKRRAIRPTNNYGTSSFIHLGKSPLKNPPSVYAAKGILGLVL